jgi:ABC-type lipoprotein export system ATPase subunit
MPDAAIVVETRNLTKVYGDGVDVRALDDVSLAVHAGEFVALVGPSGSGKSTLLNLIGALDRPSGGDVIIDGVPLTQVRDLDRFRSRTVGFVFQTHNLIPTLTARENVEVPMYETDLRRAARRSRAEELLELVGLGDRLSFMPNQLSGGQRQRVAVARALANHPRLILADEPTGNLDTTTTAEIVKLLLDLNRTHATTLILVTHNHEVACAARRIITLRDGKVQQDVQVASEWESQLLDFKSSALGQAILRDGNLPAEMSDIAPRLRAMLEHV